MKALHAVFAAQHLDEGVGVGDGGGFIADHDEYMLGGLAEGQHAVVKSRRRVHDHHIHSMVQIAEGADDAGLLGVGKIGHALDAGGRRHDLQAMRPGDDGVLQRTLAADDVTQMEPGVQSQHHIDVRKPEVGVHQHHIAALRRDRHRQIRRHGRLAHAALAAGHRNDLDRARGVELLEGFRLAS